VQVKRAIASFWSDKACGILCILHTYIPSMGGRPHCRLSFVHGQEYGRALVLDEQDQELCRLSVASVSARMRCGW
jgi:hypothetical protein